MSTLSQIADYICGQLGQPFNGMLKETVKFAIRNWRATLIRRDAERNGLDYVSKQRVVLKLQPHREIDDCDVIIKSEDGAICNVYRSVVKVPQPIRLKGEDPFLFVGEVDGRETFTFTRMEEIPFVSFNKYTSKEVRYDYINGHLFVFTIGKYRTIAVNNPFADPIEAANFDIYCTECLEDDDEYPFSIDMIEGLVDAILTGRFKLKPIDPGVEVIKDDNN